MLVLSKEPTRLIHLPNPAIQTWLIEGHICKLQRACVLIPRSQLTPTTILILRSYVCAVLEVCVI